MQHRALASLGPLPLFNQWLVAMCLFTLQWEDICTLPFRWLRIKTNTDSWMGMVLFIKSTQVGSRDFLSLVQVGAHLKETLDGFFPLQMQKLICIRPKKVGQIFGSFEVIDLKIVAGKKVLPKGRLLHFGGPDIERGHFRRPIWMSPFSNITWSVIKGMKKWMFGDFKTYHHRLWKFCVFLPIWKRSWISWFWECSWNPQ